MSKSYNKLRGRIIEICGTIKQFSLSMDISENSVYQKLSGNQGREFTQSEILKICKILEIPKNDIPEYFFS